MSSLDSLKKIIRKELTEVIRQELPKILSEMSVPPVDYRKGLQEQMKKASVPLTLNEEPKMKPVKFSGNNPLATLLNETSISMTTDDITGFGLDGPIHREASIGDVNSMLNNARKSTNIEAVEIDTVPDFSAKIAVLKQKGLF